MKHRLLLVEDDDDIRTDLTAVLADAGYEVIAAGDGVAALRYLRGAEVPKLVLLDLMMPEMDGWQLRLELLKDRRLSTIPVVLLSAAGNLPTEAVCLGAVGFLSKPFEVSHLLHIVEQCCNLGERFD